MGAVTTEMGVTMESLAAEDVIVTPVEAGVVTTTGSVALVGAIVWATTAAAVIGVAAEVVTATVTGGTVR